MGEEKLNVHEDTSTETCQQEEVFADVSKGIPWGVEHCVEDYLVYQCIQAAVANTTDQVAYKPQKCLSHSSRG